ncbi:hypothetical protein Tco_1184359 [Tanacetum coccineum]
MSEKAKDPEVIAKKISHKPIDYEKLNSLIGDFGKRFSPQQELSAEQAFWFRIISPTIEPSYTPHVIVDVPSELPKVSLVSASLKKLKFHLTQFDSVVKKRTTPNALEEDIFNVFDKDLLNEITEVQIVFDQMEAMQDLYGKPKTRFGGNKHKEDAKESVEYNNLRHSLLDLKTRFKHMKVKGQYFKQSTAEPSHISQKDILKLSRARAHAREYILANTHAEWLWELYAGATEAADGEGGAARSRVPTWQYFHERTDGKLLSKVDSRRSDSKNTPPSIEASTTRNPQKNHKDPIK